MSILVFQLTPFELKPEPLNKKERKQKNRKQRKMKYIETLQSETENDCEMCSPYGQGKGWIYGCEDSWIRCPGCTPPELY